MLVRHTSAVQFTASPTTRRPAAPCRQVQPAAPCGPDPEQLAVDYAAGMVCFGDRLLALPPTETRLLAHFTAHPNRVFSRKALIEHIGRDSGLVDERTVDVWIGRLRRALQAHGVPVPLRTVRAYGYVLDQIND